jgi:CRISPR-associated protein Cas2
MNTTGTLVAGEAPLYAVCYDISDDRERRRADRLLKGYGFRRQKSVFECHMSEAQKRQLHLGLERLGLKTGHVRIYRLQANSEPKVFGAQPERGPDENFSYSI